MKSPGITAAMAFVVYLLLTAGSGDLLLWSLNEIIVGLFLSIVVGIIARNIFCMGGDYRMLSPKRIGMFIIYIIGPFFMEMVKANFDVAYRVITGKINPGIVKIKSGLKTDFGVTLLANSITLTPGTLTVDIDEKTNDLYVHWINIDKSVLEKLDEEKCCDSKKVCGNFVSWIGRIAE